MKTTLMLFMILALAPVSSRAGIDEAISLYNRGQYKQATSALVQLRNSSPKDADVRLWLGKAYLKIREWDKSVAEMEKATELKPTALHHLWLGRACGARAEHSFLIKAFGWARRVIREFETACRLSPEDVDIRFDLLEFYLNAPGAVGGGRDKAEMEALSIAKLNPRKGYVVRSAIFSKDKKWELAKRELMQASTQNPEDPDAYKDVAAFLLERQNFREALQYAQKALMLNKASKRSRLIAAASTIQLGTDLDYSEKVLNDLASGPLTDDDPAFEEVYYWLGRCYAAKGNSSKARESFSAALAYNPEFEKAKQYLDKLK